MNKVLHGDCLDKLKELEDNSVDSIVTDPPYELGFMGKSWDNTGIANNPVMWAECLRVLKPGGHLLAFSGTRTYHRMACAIEDAGFEVRDMIEWVYGSGFPKSLNIGKAVDKLQGNEREDIGANPSYRKMQDEPSAYNLQRNPIATKGNSEWEGWGTALKPAHEPICMARKPLAEKTVAENCLKYGTGGINIDESRVEITDTKNGFRPNSANKQYTPTDSFAGGKITEQHPQGRFPANLLHDNSEEVRECFPESSTTGKRVTPHRKTSGVATNFTMGNPLAEYTDSGSASRFFKSIIYQAKASKSERNNGCEELPLGEPPASARSKPAEGRENALGSPRANNHPTVKPIALMEYLIKMVTPKGGVVLDPFAGSGSTLVAAKQNGYQYIGIEMTDEYIKIIDARLASVI